MLLLSEAAGVVCDDTASSLWSKGKMCGTNSTPLICIHLQLCFQVPAALSEDKSVHPRCLKGEKTILFLLRSLAANMVLLQNEIAGIYLNINYGYIREMNHT